MSHASLKPDLLLRDVTRFYNKWGILDLDGQRTPAAIETPSADVANQFVLRLGIGSIPLGTIVATDRNKLDGAAITSDIYTGWRHERWGGYLGDIAIRYVLTDARNPSPHAWQKKYTAYDGGDQVSIVTDEIIYAKNPGQPCVVHQVPGHPHVSDEELSALTTLIDWHTARPLI